jgi:hypothetical protein
MTCLKSLQFSWKRRSFHFEIMPVLHRVAHHRLHQMINDTCSRLVSVSAGWVLPRNTVSHRGIALCLEILVSNIGRHYAFGEWIAESFDFTDASSQLAGIGRMRNSQAMAIEFFSATLFLSYMMATGASSQQGEHSEVDVIGTS